MNSITLTLSGNTSSLSASYYPPIELDENANYVCSLIDFHTYNYISNITDKNSCFPIKVGNKDYREIRLIEGTYEFVDIISSLEKICYILSAPIEIKLVPKTKKIHIICSGPVEIDLSRNDSLGSVFGFAKRILKSGDEKKTFVSDYIPNITNINAIRLDCNIITGSFLNNDSSHTLHQFYPTANPGYKIIEVPKNLIYLPVVGRTIQHLNIKIVDQDNEIVNFCGETITCRIHIKKETH